MYKTVNGKKRIFYIDFIRALAIALVVLAHTVRIFFYNPGSPSFNLHFSAPFIDIAVLGVPLFLMISGALLLDRDYGIVDFFKRRYIRILIPYFFWEIVLAIFIIIYKEEPLNLTYFFFHYHAIEFWFVWMIALIYLFIPLINIFIKKYEMKGVEYLLIIWLVISLIVTFTQDIIQKFEIIYYLCFSGYLVLGYYLTNKKFKIQDNKILIVSFALFVIATLVNVCYTLSFSFLNNELIYFKYLSIVVVAQAVGLFMFIRYFTLTSVNSPDSIRNKIYTFFKESQMFKIVFVLSTFSYGIYLSHFIPLYFVRYFSEKYIEILAANPIIWMPATFVFVVLTTCISLWILDKIPILKYFSGAH